MDANTRHSDAQENERAESTEPRVAEAGRGERRPPTLLEVAGVLAATPRAHSTTVVVPPALHGLLKEAARRERTALSVIVVRALRAYLSQEHPDLSRRLMPVPVDWDAPRPTAREERPS